jgi:type VI secretion system protein ImpH
VALQPGGTSPVPAPGQAPMAPLLRAIDHLSGLGRGQGAHGPAGELAWLRHAGLQNGAPRSMASLLALLRDRLKVQFSGEQFVGGWHALAPSERACLHSTLTRPRAQRGVRMGTSLGARAWDQASGMALSAPPLPAAQFAALLPGGARCALLGWLVARHLQAEFTVTLTLTLAEAPATTLGATTPLAPRLGRSAWLSSRAGDAQHYRPARFVLSAPTVNLTKAA